TDGRILPQPGGRTRGGRAAARPPPGLSRGEASRPATMLAMIVDVHTHAPRFETKEAALHAQAPTERVPMRPDRPDPEAVTWDEYLNAMDYVDRAVVFNIAAPPEGY